MVVFHEENRGIALISPDLKIRFDLSRSHED
jgi:hypothetical protein